MKRDLKLEELVIKEATNLKQYATVEELLKLDYYNLDGNSGNNCIYGQMTGDCETKRSFELINKCCELVYDVSTDEFWSDLDSDFIINKEEIVTTPTKRLIYYISPIELFLFKYKSNYAKKSTKIQKLVKFLRDETKTLKF